MNWARLCSLPGISADSHVSVCYHGFVLCPSEVVNLVSCIEHRKLPHVFWHVRCWQKEMRNACTPMEPKSSKPKKSRNTSKTVAQKQAKHRPTPFRSANALDCEALGDVWLDLLPLLSRYFLISLVCCSLAPSVCRRCFFLLQCLWIFESNLMIALPASPFVFIIWSSVHLKHASVRIWMNLFPFASAGVIGPIVFAETASRRSYMFLYCCFNDARVALPIVQGGHYLCCCVQSRSSMYFIASGYSCRTIRLTCHSHSSLCRLPVYLWSPVLSLVCFYFWQLFIRLICLILLWVSWFALPVLGVY